MQQAVCYNCFRYIPVYGPCPYCGYDPKRDEGRYRIALRPGTPLANRYVIGRALGQGGFGVTYVALDSQTRARVAIKEYLPAEFVSRDQESSKLLLNSIEQQADFDYGKQQFLAEARTLAEFVGSENIVNIHSYFEENGTAYFAMEFMEGVNLKQYMERHGGPLPVHEANKILLPVMEALDWVHSKGIVHRDISPDNIMIRGDGKAKLIDFGAARYSTGEKSKSLDVILKHGFAPYEQYSRRGRQGPYTDVYAMAATYYYAITGRVPPDAVDRMDEDTIQPPGSFGVKIRKSTEAVLMKALAVSAKDRWQRMSEFHAALLETMPLPFSPEAGEENREKEKQELAYREACRLQETAKTEAEYRAVSRQFERLQGYKDSRERVAQCGEAVAALKEEQRKQKEAEAKARAEEKEKKRLEKAALQTREKKAEAQKPERDGEQPKKKKSAAVIAAVLALAILLGLAFGSGLLKKNPAVSETAASATRTEAPAAAELTEPEHLPPTEPTGVIEAPSELKAGFLFLHDENFPDDLNFMTAAREACAKLGLQEGTGFIIKTNIPEGQECYDAAAELVDEGCNFIFANSYGHESYMIQAAREFPEVQFFHASGTQAHSLGLVNYHNVYASIYEGRFLGGVAAGLKLNQMIEEGIIPADQAKVGYVGTFPYAEVKSGYTSFFLGVRYVCPSAAMEVTFTYSWYDSTLERAGAIKLINNGCVLLSGHSDSMGVPAECQFYGIPFVFYNGYAAADCPDTFIVASRIDWVPCMEFAMTCIMNGETIPADWTGTIATGSVKLTEINGNAAAPGTAEKLAEVQALLESGALRVFDTSAWTVNGKPLTEYLADVDDMGDFLPETNVIFDGYFHESEFRSAPYFDIDIDGITNLDA